MNIHQATPGWLTLMLLMPCALTYFIRTIERVHQDIRALRDNLVGSECFGVSRFSRGNRWMR